MTFRFKLLHHFTCQIEASGAVAGDCEDEGLWRFPGAEVFFREGEANGKALGARAVLAILTNIYKWGRTMKCVSRLNIELGVLVAILVIVFKFCSLPWMSKENRDVLYERVITASDNKQKDTFLLFFRGYIFFIQRHSDEVSVRVFRIIGLPVATYRYELQTGEGGRY